MPSHPFFIFSLSLSPLSVFLSLSLFPFLFVLQASELGMTSAFYKYILTTMVRAGRAPRPLSLAAFWCAIFFPPPSFSLPPKKRKGGKVKVKVGEGAKGKAAKKEKGGKEMNAKRKGVEVKVRTGVMWPSSSSSTPPPLLFLPPPSSSSLKSSLPLLST